MSRVFSATPRFSIFWPKMPIAELVADAAGNAIRLWVAGCSTGEETYTLAMLFSEAIKAAGADVKLQIFASDADAQAVAAAREGMYPFSIEAQVSAARLEQFFIREEHGYRVAPSLRASIVFAVQDVLADPPFSKLNMISCRNLMIYLKPEAQAKIIEVFDFSLRAGGLLLLGAAETIGAPDGRFAVISKPARLYRKTDHGAARTFCLPASRRAQPPRARRPASGGARSGYRRIIPQAGAGALCAGRGHGQPAAGMSVYLRTDRAAFCISPPATRPMTC